MNAKASPAPLTLGQIITIVVTIALSVLGASFKVKEQVAAIKTRQDVIYENMGVFQRDNKQMLESIHSVDIKVSKVEENQRMLLEMVKEMKKNQENNAK